MGAPLWREPVGAPLLRLLPLAALLVLIVPVVAGLAGVLLPALGFLPALGRSEFSFGPFHQLAEMPGLGRSAALSLWTGLAASAIAFAIVMLFVAGWRDTRVFRAIERLVSPLLSVPHAASAFGLAFLIAPSGLLFRLVSPWATGWDRPPDLLILQDPLGLVMILGLVVKEIPFLFLMSLAALPQTRAAEMQNMTAALGYGRIVGFIHGVFPALYRQMRLPVLAVIAFSTAVVDVALILGPSTPGPLAVRILSWHNDPDLDLHFVAAAGAVLQLAITTGAILIWLAGEQFAVALGRTIARSGWRARRDGSLRIVAAGLIALAAAIVLAGIALLALWSIAGPWIFPQALPDGLSIATWMRAAQSLSMPFRDTIALAATTSLVALILALGSLEFAVRSGRNRVLVRSSILYVPLLVPQIAFLFGLQILFTFAGFDGSFAVVALVHLVFVFPYVLLSLSEPWESWDPRYRHVVRALGRSDNAVFWRVRLPMLARPALTAAALGFAVSTGLYLPTLLIGAGRWPTVTTEAVALASGGDPRLIGATALAQALLPFLGFLVAARASAVLFRNRRLMRPSG